MQIVKMYESLTGTSRCINVEKQSYSDDPEPCTILLNFNMRGKLCSREFFDLQYE